MLPSRLEELTKRIESGKPITKEQVQRVAQLQAFDLAKIGRDFVGDALEREKQYLADSTRREQEKLNVIL